MRPALALLVCACAFAWSWSGASRRALADAVPPPPRSCPPGKVGITSHHGPECVDPAPKDCPPGWYPQIRGQCLVQLCTADDQCGKGLVCKAADVCQHDFLQEWGWGANEAQPAPDPFVLAGPPQRFDPPRKVTATVGVCGGGVSCPDDNECRKAKVCLPPAVSRPGVWKGQAKPKQK